LKTLNSWGNTYFSKNDVAQARQQFEKAQEIFTNKDADVNEYPSAAAETFTNLGMSHFREQNYAVADSFYGLADKIYKDLQSKNAGQTMPEFGQLLLNRAENFKRMPTTTPNVVVEKHFLDAAEVFQKANKSEGSNVYSRSLGVTYNFLGDFYQNQKNYKEADAAYKKALQIQTDFADRNPTASGDIDLAVMV
jgi:tetratricopeptide (TPR) repeat protein